MSPSTTRAEDAQGTPTQSHISPSILVYEVYGEPVFHQPADLDQMTFIVPLICPSTRQNLATCSANQGSRKHRFAPTLKADLTKCICQLVLESQLPDSIVKVIFTINNHSIKLTVLRGS